MHNYIADGQPDFNSEFIVFFMYTVEPVKGQAFGPVLTDSEVALQR